MGFVLLGVLLTVLKLTGLTVVANWSWWWVLLPYALAAAWWAFADATGKTQRDAMAREDLRTAKRREKQYEALGLRLPPVGRDGRRQQAPRAEEDNGRRDVSSKNDSAAGSSGQQR